MDREKEMVREGKKIIVMEREKEMMEKEKK